MKHYLFTTKDNAEGFIERCENLSAGGHMYTNAIVGSCNSEGLVMAGYMVSVSSESALTDQLAREQGAAR